MKEARRPETITAGPTVFARDGLIAAMARGRLRIFLARNWVVFIGSPGEAAAAQATGAE